MLKIRILYLFILLIFVIYSYSQVDLNLTLSDNRTYQIFQNQLIQLGYYHRPVSAMLFLALVILLFGLYFWLIDKTRKGEMELKDIKKIIGLTLILIIAYPAFSHDIFNYMFDARIVTHYGLSPYFFKALDFPLDPWTRFMHWTHRYYPYGPAWLWLSFVPSFLGMGKFVLTLGLFKIMFGGFHIFNCWLIYTLVKQHVKQSVSTALVFYALNPLVIIESILSPHNETVMLTLALLFIYFLHSKKYLLSAFFIIASVAIKYISAVLIPITVFIKNDINKIAVSGFFLWTLVLFPVILQRSLNPWYFVPVLGLAAVAIKSDITGMIAVGISGAALATYYPYLLFGDYGNITVNYQRWGMLIAFIICATAFILCRKKFR